MAELQSPESKTDNSRPPSTASSGVDPTGLMLALLGSLLFSLKPIFIKFNYALDVDAATQLTLRMLFSLPFFWAFAAFTWRRRRAKGEPTELSRRLLWQMIGIGLLGYYVSSMLDMEGLGRITAQFERLILYTYPTFVVLLGAWLFGQPLIRQHILALAVSYLGLALIFTVDFTSFGNKVVSGALMVLLCSLTYALYLLMSRDGIKRVGSGIFSAVTMTAGTAGVIVHFLAVNELGDLVVPVAALWHTLGMAILATVIPSLLVAEAIGRIGAGPTSLAGGVGPVFTAIFAILLLGEPFTAAHGLGMALVITGIVILGRSKSL